MDVIGSVRFHVGQGGRQWEGVRRGEGRTERGSDGGLRAIWKNLQITWVACWGGDWEAYLGLGPTTVRLGFGFVKGFFVGLDFHGADQFLEPPPFVVRLE